MYKVLSYNSASILEISDELLNEFKDVFAIEKVSDIPAEQVLKQDFDLLEIPLKSFSQFSSFLAKQSVQSHSLQLADAILRVRSSSLDEQLSLSLAIQQYLSSDVKIVDTTGRVLLVGDLECILALIYQLSKLGFSRYLLASSQITDAAQIEQRIKKISFGLEVAFSKIEELNQSTLISDLMIINLENQSVEKSDEIYESLTYFNYLSRNAIFLDLQDIKNKILHDEAVRTGLKVINSMDIYRQKYKYLLQQLKNTSLV